MANKLFPNRTAALIAAEEKSRERGYSDEESKKWSAAFAVHPFGHKSPSWEAWPIHHIVRTSAAVKVYRRPISDS